MKYIKNWFDDRISKVMRDKIVGCQYREPGWGGGGKSDMVQVYPWEDLGKKSVYKIRGKWFITKDAWEDYTDNRFINFGDLVAHVYNDPRVHIHRLGWFKFIIGSIQAWRINRALEKKQQKEK
jgi:hypothetical protein